SNCLHLLVVTEHAPHRCKHNSGQSECRCKTVKRFPLKMDSLYIITTSLCMNTIIAKIIM
ncbi:hypothetical protein L9F63_001224, partial [Diploptera punctata]